MAQINVAPTVLKNYVLTIGTDAYEKHVSEVTLTPNTSIQTWQGATPDAVFTDAGQVTWTCTLAYAQDWTTTNSLSRYLFDNQGTQKAATFKPLGATGPSFAVTLVLIPGAIGGAVNAFGTATVTLGVAGKPAFTAGA